jgi:branched-chain amino acid transport system substrate-binding protein
VASSRSLAAAPIAQAAKVPMISPASTNVAVTEKGDYIFRACFIDPFQGKVMADYAFNTLGLRKAAILRDLKSDYSMGLSDVFQARFTQLGGAIVAEETYSAGDMDFKAQLTNLRARAPQIIYCPGYYTEVGLIAKQARALGINQPLAGGDGFDSPKLYEIAGAAALEGYIYSNHYTPDSSEERVQAFVKKYTARWHHVPDALAALGYDAGGMLVDALKRSKSLDGPDLRDAIATTKDYPGVTGDITLDAHRNPSKSAVVLKITGGKPRYVATVKP